MTRTRPSKGRAALAALLVTFLWSSSWVLIRWGLDDEGLEPLSFAALRYGIAAVILVAWVAGTRLRSTSPAIGIPRTMIPVVVALGVVFYAVTQGAQFVAIDSQPAATTSVVLSWTPMIVALAAGWSLGEASAPRQFIGALLVAVGAWAYFAGDLGATLVGMTAALVGLAANVTSSLIGRGINRDSGVSPVVVTAASMAVGAIVLAGVAVIVDGIPSVSGRAWLLIGFLAIVNTALAFSLWNYSLGGLTALESAAINNTMLIQIALLAWWLLDEPLGPAEVVGIFLVTVGILATRSRAATPAANRARRGRRLGDAPEGAPPPRS